MPVTDIVTDPQELTLTITADFSAPVERLWKVFTDPRQLERFWGPPGWPATFTSFDFTVGGRALYQMQGPNGESELCGWEFTRIVPGECFEVLDGFVDESGTMHDNVVPAMRMVFSFQSTTQGSRLNSVTHFTSAQALEKSVEMGMVEGTRAAMDQIDTVLIDLREYAQGKGTRTEILDDTHVRITRLINGSRDDVWRAHQDPELLKKWLLGPDGWIMTVAEPGEKVGDSFRQMWEQDGAPDTAFGFEGEILLIDAPRREVTTEKMIGTDGPSTTNDLQLYEEDGATLITLLIEYPTKELRDTILATGMTDGMETSYQRLDDLVGS
ncbi:MAG: ATPase [Rhodococcus sp.]|nr:ATPase [Rhodococcus sp. (in: high G+C Gram-positive bacteria)]